MTATIQIAVREPEIGDGEPEPSGRGPGPGREPRGGGGGGGGGGGDEPSGDMATMLDAPPENPAARCRVSYRHGADHPRSGGWVPVTSRVCVEPVLVPAVVRPRPRLSRTTMARRSCGSTSSALRAIR